jgi:tRNA (guanine37-N1)-methyltransferase
VLTGGELPAMCLIDAISRMIPGVLHNEDSAEGDSFGDGLLEFPQYSRPEVWNGIPVPKILLSGDHAKVDAWRREQSLIRTAERRPDLLEKAAVSPKEREFIRKYLAKSDSI